MGAISDIRQAPGAPAVIVMAKAPRAGRVKTRLCPPLSPAQAAELYAGFLRDTVQRVRGVTEARPVVAYAPASAAAFFAARCRGFRLVAQRGHDLGARLAGAFAAVFADGAPVAVAIGGDTPTLPAAFIRRAVARLVDGGCDLVLGPSLDGGYYLIGLRGPHPELFDGVPWSTPAVFAETVRRARRAGLRVASLPPWPDVDTPADLARLARELRRDGDRAPHTSRVVARHHSWSRAAAPAR